MQIPRIVLERAADVCGARTTGSVVGRRLTRWLLVLIVCILPVARPVHAHQDIEEQIADVTRRIATDSDDARLYLRRGELHRIHEDWPAALADYDRARRLDTELDIVDFCVGRVQLEAGEPRSALRSLDRFLARKPRHPEALLLRGRAHARLGQWRAAATDYDRAISRSVEHGYRPAPETFIERAKVLKSAGPEHHARALGGLEEGIDLLGGPVVLELAALEMERILGRTDDALARLDRLAAGAVRPEPWLVQRGEILETAGRLTEARQAYGLALDALETLPVHRRNVTAMIRWERHAREAVVRLETADGFPVRRESPDE